VSNQSAQIITSNKCISRLARRKSHHTALHDTTAPNSDCPAEPRCQVFFPGGICIGRCPNFSFSPRCDVHIGLWGSPPRPSSPKWEKTCYAPIPVIVPNFIAVDQTMYKKSVTKNLLRQSKQNIPTILPYGGIITLIKK